MSAEHEWWTREWWNDPKREASIMAVGAFACALFIWFPPWDSVAVDGPSRIYTPLGHSPIIDPPRAEAGIGVQIAMDRLFMTVGAVALATVGLLAMARALRRSASQTPS